MDLFYRANWVCFVKSRKSYSSLSKYFDIIVFSFLQKVLFSLSWIAVTLPTNKDSSNFLDDDVNVFSRKLPRPVSIMFLKCSSGMDRVISVLYDNVSLILQ